MKKYAIIFLILICSGRAAAYTRITASSGQTPKWSSMPISYWINDRGLSGNTNGSEYYAIHASFQTWQNIQTAGIQFQYRGTTAVRSVGYDGVNLISFADDSTPLGSSTIAVTFSYFRSQSGGLFFDESDIIFNPALSFSTSAELGKFDIQSVLTHEIGHLLGLDHSALVSSVMVPFGVAAQLDQRTLAYDDIAGVTEIYPNASNTPPMGLIRGLIQSGVSPVFGAHVVAVDRDGTPLVSTVSQPDGSYLIRSLPEGTYRVYAEPLDGPVVEQNIGGVGSYYSNLKTNFGTTYFGNAGNLNEASAVTVTAGNTTVANIQTLPANATGLNVTRPAFAPRIERGSYTALQIGGEDITAGVSITTSSPDLQLVPLAFGGRISSSAPTSATMVVAVPSFAALGPKNVAVNRGSAASIVSGSVVIVDVQPANIAIAPSSGSTEGGMGVTITGANFRPDAKVAFAGLPASDVRVIDSTTILATVPAGVSGSANVVVVNFDGTWGLARQAFTYFSQPPSITRVSPLSGPPSTVVTIEGDHFDSRPQNIDVRFNGLLARVASSSPNVITTIVPFGATSGPITISVFGQNAAGPTFSVTNATMSANTAGNAYNFIDASVASGGMRVSFNNNDDSIASAALPFTFTLFRETYLEGSTISISTNGWLSLETTKNLEYQNALLPAQTVIRSDGTMGTVPASLIAPFWDDLYLRAGGAVTTRTLGVAPNRQFVAEWSGATILNETGSDLNANLTFEVILFEGSNDIQFVYQSMSGSRSDASSATIGAQDLKRTTAIQSGFNQSIVRSGSLITYRFQNGGYTLGIPDSTPPTKPLITDGGALTRSTTELWASWTSDDPESGTKEFQYAIGKTPNGTEIRPFTSTTQNSVVVTGLNLDAGTTYYFAVKAINNAGLTSDTGFSDGIRVDPAFQPDVMIIPYGVQTTSEFTGISLFAPRPMSVVLKAMDANGIPIVGRGIRNPVTINLGGGQQNATLIPETFGIQNFDGWIEAEASGAGLGIYSAIGGWDLTRLDGTAGRKPSSDFVLFHPGTTAFMVNPSTQTANVTITALGSTATQSLVIQPRARLTMTTSSVARVQSSEPLVSIERSSLSKEFTVNAGVAVSEAQSTLVFPNAIIGGGFTSTLMLANIAGIPQNVTITWATASATLSMAANSSTRFSIADLLQLPAGAVKAGALRITANRGPFGSAVSSLIAVLDIGNASSSVTVGTRPASTQAVFPVVAQGSGLFTGLSFATGDSPALITIEVYGSAAGTPKSASISLNANQQLGKLLTELVPGVTTQIGGYIRIRSDQPIWSWEIYGTDQVLASGPPL